MSDNKNKQPDREETPILEIKPSEEYHPRPMWQRVGAWVLIVMIVIATGIFALWGKVVP